MDSVGMYNFRKPHSGVDSIRKITLIGDCSETSNLARRLHILGFDATDCGHETGSLPDSTITASLAKADAIIIATACPRKYHELLYKRGSALVAARAKALFIDFSDVPETALSTAKTRIRRLGKRYTRGSMMQADAVLVLLKPTNNALSAA